jgi:hypothetical protein
MLVIAFPVVLIEVFKDAGHAAEMLAKQQDLLSFGRAKERRRLGAPVDSAPEACRS